MPRTKVRDGKLSEFRPASVNVNKHTERGFAMLDDAMREEGYVAPITVAADGESLDGSARLERAFDIFGDDAIVVEHTGDRPVVMVRTDIPAADTPQARRIALAANRIQQVDYAEDLEVLALLAREQPEVTEGLWYDDELADLLGDLLEQEQEPEPPPGSGAGAAAEWLECPKCGHRWVQ